MAKTPHPFSDRDLLARIGRSAGSKAGYKQLVRQLGLGGGPERRLLLEQLARMVERGELRRLAEELWAVPRPVETQPTTLAVPGIASRNPRKKPEGGGEDHDQNFADSKYRERTGRGGRERLLSGRLELHRDGYGFVRLEAGKPGAPGRAASETGDVFIPPPALHGAMHGDLVLVEEDAPAWDGRRSGRVARVLTRRNPTLVGIFHYGRPLGRRRSPADREHSAPFAGNYVQPLDERLGGPVEIPEEAEIPALDHGSPHRTLGESAEQQAALGADRAGSKNRRSKDGQSGHVEAVEDATDGLPLDRLPLDRWPLEGLAVEVEITSFPQGGRAARGRVIEVLGPPDAFGVDVEIIIRKHAIPHTFPAHVLAEAEERAQGTVDTLPPEELALREDFRGPAIVTIDGETARDFDDAVLVQGLANGHTELQVHIADVGWYVRAGSALDTEARVRGTSVYFPDRAVPMLPHALSSGMCSLLPHQDRLVLSCVMEIDPRGEIVGYRVGEAIIRSVRRLTYTSVQRCLNASPRAEGWNGGRVAGEGTPPIAEERSGRSSAPGETQIPSGNDKKSHQVTPEPSAEDRLERERIGLEQPDLPEALDRMLDLALRLNRKRARRGSIDFDLPEPVVEFDPDGNMKAIVRSERGWAHRLIEEFMLSANECVATWLTAQGIPSIYRIHEMPDPKRIVDFEETAAGFGQTLGIGALPVKRMAMKSDRRELQRRGGKGGNGRPAPAQELPERIPVTPQMYQRLVKRIQGTPEERILAYLMLRSLKQARYAEKNEGHFALASPCYTHFTSPIRRYPDLLVHRLLRTMLRRGADPRGGAILSGDSQPWAAELARAQGRHAAMPFSTPFSGVPAKAARIGEEPRRASLQVPPSSDPLLLAQQRGRRRGERAGRIGWSVDGQGAEVSSTSGERSRATQANSLEGEKKRRFPAGMTEKEAEVEAFANAAPFAEVEEWADAPAGEPIPAAELADMAVESSQAERRAADAERELIEWKKMKFMADKIGSDFRAIILSVTKYGFFVELDELFIEGLVPLGSLGGDFYSFRDTDRTICGARTGHCFRVGDRVEVLLDRIDRQQRRLQFALLPGTEPVGTAGGGSVRAGKSEAKKIRAEARGKEKAFAKATGARKGKVKAGKNRRKG